MPADMVLAITHSKIRCQPIDILYKERLDFIRYLDVEMASYKKYDECKSREKIENSYKNSSYIDMFRYWS